MAGLGGATVRGQRIPSSRGRRERQSGAAGIKRTLHRLPPGPPGRGALGCSGRAVHQPPWRRRGSPERGGARPCVDVPQSGPPGRLGRNRLGFRYEREWPRDWPCRRPSDPAGQRPPSRAEDRDPTASGRIAPPQEEAQQALPTAMDDSAEYFEWWRWQFSPHRRRNRLESGKPDPPKPSGKTAPSGAGGNGGSRACRTFGGEEALEVEGTFGPVRLAEEVQWRPTAAPDPDRGGRRGQHRTEEHEGALDGRGPQRDGKLAGYSRGYT